MILKAATKTSKSLNKIVVSIDLRILVKVIVIVYEIFRISDKTYNLTFLVSNSLTVVNQRLVQIAFFHLFDLRSFIYDYHNKYSI